MFLDLLKEDKTPHSRKEGIVFCITKPPYIIKHFTSIGLLVCYKQHKATSSKPPEKPAKLQHDILIYYLVLGG